MYKYDHFMTREISLYEAIYLRYSVRKYQDRAIEREKLDRVLHFTPDSLSDGNVKFIPLDGDTMRKNIEKAASVNVEKFFNTVKLFNAPTYFVMVANETPHFMFETGYRGEQAILAATSLGLGTCWIGELFAEDKIRALLDCDARERVIALSPIGYASKSIVDNAVNGLVRRVAGSVKRKPIHEIVFAERYGNPMYSFSGEYSRWEKVFNAVRVAPSWANYQPWRFVVSGDSVYTVVVPPRDKQGFEGSQIKSGMDYSLLDMGIAMSHFTIACKAEGIKGNWVLFGNDKSEARLKLQIPEEDRLIAVWK